MSFFYFLRYKSINSLSVKKLLEKGLRGWLAERRIKTLYIEPGSPWQNGYVESFNARFREECLDREQLWTLTEARVVVEDWRWKYNNIRPHRSLGYITPLEFSKETLEQYEPNQCRASSRPTASLRPDIDMLYNVNHITASARLTKAMAQFEYLDQYFPK